MRAILQISAAAVLAGGAIVSAGQQAQVPSELPLSNPVRERGTSVTPAFEGWYYDRDGSIRLLIGYFNRNTKQALDVPIGPNNRIEPGGPDQGQPTHFDAGRQWGVVAVKVPKEFGDRTLTWTIGANGYTNSVTLHTKADFIVEPFEDAGSKNTPPTIRFQPGGIAFAGPPVIVAASFTTAISSPLRLPAWVADLGPKTNPPQQTERRGGAAGAGGAPTPPPLRASWHLHRGPAAVTFDPIVPAIDKETGQAVTTATFAAPGEYILRLQANDSTGEGGSGFQCCWTNTYVAVTVKPARDAATGR
jgi:hypothetical protein